MTDLSRRELNRITRERRILDAALTVFSGAGYSGTTMDVVAEAAGISKPTLYQYFPSKEDLFGQMMLAKRDDMLMPFTIPAEGGMVGQLHAFAWAYADTVMQPELLALARLIIGEVQRFPEIGRAYQAAGPDRVLEGLMANLGAHRAAGRLAFEDAELAAQDLWGLILSAPRTFVLYRPECSLSREALGRYVHNGLGVFLRAYSTRPARDLETLKGLAIPTPQKGGT